MKKKQKTTVLTKPHVHSHNLHTFFNRKYIYCIYILYIFIYSNIYKYDHMIKN